MVGPTLQWGVKILEADINYAWPTAEIAVLGPEAAITIVHQKRSQETRKTQLKLKRNWQKNIVRNLQTHTLQQKRE